MEKEILNKKREREPEEEICEIPFTIVKNCEFSNNYICLTLNFKSLIILRGISFKKEQIQGTISFSFKSKRIYKTLLNENTDFEFFHFYENIPFFLINIVLQVYNNININGNLQNAFQIFGIKNKEYIKQYSNNSKLVYCNKQSDWINQGRILYGEKICDSNFDKLFEEYEYKEKSNLFRNIMKGDYEESEKLIKTLISKNLFKFNLYNYSIKISKELNYFSEQNKILFRAASEYNTMLKRLGDKNIEEYNLNEIEINTNQNINILNDIIDNNINNINNINTNQMISEYDKMIHMEKIPKARSEHCFALDEENNILYLFGGNNSSSNLNDLWSYNLINKKWELLSENNPNCNIPPPISFPKMIFVKRTKQLLVVGKKNNSQNKNEDKFFIYDTILHKWSVKNFVNEKILNLKEEFQICYDDDNNIIYLIGGRSRTKKRNNNNIDFYKININTNKIENIYENELDITFKDEYSRYGHCLIYDNIKNCIYIFGGYKKNKDKIIPMYRMIKYDISKKKTKEIYHNINYFHFSKSHIEIKPIYGISYFYSKKKRLAFFFGGSEGDFLSNKFIIFNLDKEVLYNIPNPSNDNVLISKRFNSSMIYSDNFNRGFIFGGRLSDPNNNVSDDFYSFQINITSLITKDIVYEKFYYTYIQELIYQNKISDAFNIIKRGNFNEKKINWLLDSMLNCPNNQTEENIKNNRHKLAIFLMNGIKDKINN